MTRDILIKARGLIDEPEKWCKGASKKGESLCAHNAVNKAAPRRVIGQRRIGFRSAIKALGGTTKLINFNDHPDTTHADIMALFDRVIDSLEAGNGS